MFNLLCALVLMIRGECEDTISYLSNFFKLKIGDIHLQAKANQNSVRYLISISDFTNSKMKMYVAQKVCLHYKLN